MRDLNYIKDTVKAFLSAKDYENAIGQVINIGSGQGVSIAELAALILDICNSDAKIVSKRERVRPDRSEVMKLVCDNSKAKELMIDLPPDNDYRGGDFCAFLAVLGFIIGLSLIVYGIAAFAGKAGKATIIQQGTNAGLLPLLYLLALILLYVVVFTLLYFINLA